MKNPLAGGVQVFPRKTAFNSVAIFGGEALSRAATFVVAVVIARQFGPGALGQYGYALALASTLLLVPDLGLSILAVRELASDPRSLRPLFWSIHWLKLPAAAALVVFTALFGPHGIQDDGRRLLFYVLMARVLLQTFSQLYMAIFKAFEQMHYIAVQQFFNALLVVAWAGAALALHAGLGWVVAALVAGQAAETWLGWRIVQRAFSPGRVYRWDGRFLRALLVAGIPIGITTLLQALNLRIDILVLSLFASNRELGNFQAAAWFPVGTFLFASLLMSVLFPKLSRVLQISSSSGNAYLESLLKNGILLMTLASLAVWLGAPHLLRWFFGASLGAATSTLRILAATLPFLFLNTSMFYVFVALERRVVYMGTLALGVALGAVLNLVLAAHYGAPGSALADLAREFLLSVVYLCHLMRSRCGRTAGLALLKVFLGAAALAAVPTILGGPVRLVTRWPATGNLLVLAGTLLFLGLPRLREWLLLTDDTL